MNKLIHLYKTGIILEILFGTIAVFFFFYYRAEDWGGIALMLFVYSSLVASLLIGLKFMDATERHIQLKDEYLVIGHIANSIKLLTMILLLISGIYFFSTTIHLINLFSSRDLIYSVILSAFIAWNVFSFFNFFAYFLVANKNRKLRIPILNSDIV
jgi:hypothetical protein